MSKLENVKNHLKNNKVTYIACGVTAVVVSGVTYYFTRNTGALKQSIEIVGETAVNNAPTINSSLNYKPTNVINNIFEFVERSTPSKQVGLLSEDGKTLKSAWSSISEAARQTGHHPTMISKNVNGHIPSLNGDKFVAISDLVEAAA
jgi:hypothetical protein